MAKEDVTSLHTQRYGQFVRDVDQPGQSTKNNWWSIVTSSAVSPLTCALS